ncbi:GntR family transcriptional regulator [Teichococcus deserti]|uniref:GntR family transcriptional regulator n=1 Tax=Teichococcus deserti TaxID=1817963 RepID=UPI0009FB729E
MAWKLPGGMLVTARCRRSPRMTTDPPRPLTGRGGPAAWRQIELALTGGIERGLRPPGQTLPRGAALATRFGVNKATLRRALAEMAGKRLLRARRPRHLRRARRHPPCPGRRHPLPRQPAEGRPHAGGRSPGRACAAGRCRPGPGAGLRRATRSRRAPSWRAGASPPILAPRHGMALPHRDARDAAARSVIDPSSTRYLVVIMRGLSVRPC